MLAKVRVRLARQVAWLVVLIVAIATGSVVVAARVADAAPAPAGTVVAWGVSDVAVVTVPTGLSGVTQIAAGRFHSLALKDDGTVVAWGSDTYGQASVPTGLTGVVQIAAGAAHSLALKDDGTVVAWGGQESGPVGLTGVTQIAASAFDSLALKDDGTVVAWGPDASVPAGLTGVIQVAAGGSHFLALKNDGTVVAWGSNDHGQSAVPAGLTGVTQIAAGEAHSVALKHNGTVTAWGRGAPAPTGLTGVTQVAAGGYHTLALKADGTVVAWGDYDQQTPPPGLNGVTQVAGGGSHSLALVVHRAVVQFQDRTLSVAENDGVVRVPVERTGRTGVAASMHYARIGGTAKPDVDFALPAGTVRFAPGQTRATIPLAVRNDVWPEPIDTVLIGLSRPGPRTSTGGLFTLTVTIGVSDQRPDALISNTPRRSGYIGDNIYNTTGAGQTVTQTGRRGTSIWFWARIRNAGSVSAEFRVTGSDADHASRVRYYNDDGWNITDVLRSSAGSKVRMSPGEHVLIRVQVIIGPHARMGTVKSAAVTARWIGDGPRRDLVRAQVRVVS